MVPLSSLIVCPRCFLLAFGFCEYSDPEATLRALRLLHNFKLGDKTLVVRITLYDRAFLTGLFVGQSGLQNT